MCTLSKQESGVMKVAIGAVVGVGFWNIGIGDMYGPPLEHLN